MKEIPLTQGYVALVDDADFALVSEYKWYAHRQRRRVCAKASVGGDKLFLHRLLLRAPKGSLVDHKNGDALDNRRENLRLCDTLGNARSVRRKRLGVSSRFRGVYFYARDAKWVAEIKIGGQQRYLGRFDEEEAAARAYDAEAIRSFGEFAAPNFPA